MTKKHFNALAVLFGDALRESIKTAPANTLSRLMLAQDLADAVAIVAQEDNAAFDRGRFIAAINKAAGIGDLAGLV